MLVIDSLMVELLVFLAPEACFYSHLLEAEPVSLGVLGAGLRRMTTLTPASI